jgi:hypothetical protein
MASVQEKEQTIQDIHHRVAEADNRAAESMAEHKRRTAEVE